MQVVRWAIGSLVLAVLLVFGGAGVFAQYNYPAPAASGGPQEELKTAITHAGFAAKYDTLNEVTLHLHHVVNCIVGSKDKAYDAQAGNPCQGQGNGILADVPAGTAKDTAWWAAHVADEAIAMKALPQAKAAGHVAEVLLTDVQKTK